MALLLCHTDFASPAMAEGTSHDFLTGEMTFDYSFETIDRENIDFR